MQGPKITITRAPTIDQSDLEFLYPIPDIPDTETSTTSNNVVKQIPTSESPSLPGSPIKIELNCFRIEDDEEEEKCIPDKVSTSRNVFFLKKFKIFSRIVTSKSQPGFLEGFWQVLF